MAETTTLPSPSVFPLSSPDNSRDTPQCEQPPRCGPPAVNKKRSVSTNKSQPPTNAVRTKQSKSRNGCTTCKAKRLKCDETKPSCQQCKKRSVECGGYKRDFKWKPFGETSVASHVARHRRVSACAPEANSVPHHSHASLSEAPKNTFVLKQEVGNHDGSKLDTIPSFSQQVFTTPLRTQPSQFPEESALIGHGTKHLVETAEHERTTSLRRPDVDDYGDGVQGIIRSPALNLSRHAWTRGLASEAGSERDIEADESPSENNQLATARTYLYEQPLFSQASREMLMLRFDRLTCGILSVKDGPNENPWRTLIAPMAKSSAALYHAISSMTAFHSCRDVPVLRITGHEHKSLSVHNLLEGIKEGSMNLDTAIATTLALAFAECWDQHISSGNDHIKGARTMINLALAQHKEVPLTGVDLARMKFLCNSWVYLDVIARITAVDDDTSDDYDNLYTLYSTSSGPDTHDPGQTGFGINFGLPVDAQLDPLMGCAITLFPLIGRVANLVRRVCRSTFNATPIITQAVNLKRLLEQWDPPAFIEPPEDPTMNVQHSLQTAEAYRWATLLYLHQAVPEIPCSSSVEMARKVMVNLATVPLASRCIIIHIYPLMMAGCEASTAEDRHWVLDRWEAMCQRMRIGPIDKCVDVTKEVWRRKDEYEPHPLRGKALGLHTRSMARPHPGKRNASLALPYDNSQKLHHWDEPFQGGSRRMTMGSIDPIHGHASTQHYLKTMDDSIDTSHTVRGDLHWVGVMKDWGWEVLLG